MCQERVIALFVDHVVKLLDGRPVRILGKLLAFLYQLAHPIVYFGNLRVGGVFLFPDHVKHLGDGVNFLVFLDLILGTVVLGI